MSIRTLTELSKLRGKNNRSCVIYDFWTLDLLELRVHWVTKPRGWTAAPFIRFAIAVLIGMENL